MSSSTSMPPPVDGLYANHSYKLIVSTAVSFAIATLAIIGRFTARFICRKRLEANDWFIILGYTMKCGLMVLSCLLIDFGIGRHVQTLSSDMLKQYLMTTWTGSFIYAPTIAFIKLSILSLYYVAFPQRYMKIGVWILAGIIVAWATALCLVGLLACLPIRKSWDPTVPGTCIDVFEYYYGLQIPNIITDFIIVFMPFKAIYGLRLPFSQLLQIGAVFTLGLVTCTFDIIRLVVFVDLPQVVDVTWVDLAPSIWLDLEASVAILCACLPVMRPLLNPRQFWRNNHTARKDDSQRDIDGTDIEHYPTTDKKGSDEKERQSPGMWSSDLDLGNVTDHSNDETTALPPMAYGRSATYDRQRWGSN